MENRDLIRFKHMLDSATAIIHFIDGKTRKHLNSDLPPLFLQLKMILSNI